MALFRLRVKEIAEAKGFNQSSLSRAANVHFTTIKRIYQNPHKDTSIMTLAKIAKALNVSICDLIEELPDHTEE